MREAEEEERNREGCGGRAGEEGELGRRGEVVHSGKENLRTTTDRDCSSFVLGCLCLSQSSTARGLTEYYPFQKRFSFISPLRLQLLAPL